MSGIYIAPSIWRAMDVRTASAVYASIASNPTGEPVVWEPLWNDALISRSRSIMATKFMEEPHLADCDVMVIVDDDVVWNPGDFWKIVEGARETRSIYGGVYVTRSHTNPHISSRLLPHMAIDIRATEARRPLELEYLATGFMAIHRDVFAAMLQGEFKDADGTHRIHRVTKGADRPFWPFFSPFTIEDAPGQFHYLSEDWAFGERARQLGFKAWFDQSIILQHMGLYPYTVADINRPGDPGLPSTGTDFVQVEGIDRTTGDELLDTLVDDIAEWAEERPGDIRRLMATATERLADLWRTKGDEPEDAFYRREDVGLLYVLELANWHIAGGCPIPLAREHARPGVRWLDVGAGIGTLALSAARTGAEVWAYEPNPTMRQFIEWRATKRGLTVDLCDDSVAVPDVDVVSAWHVFEHLENPEATLSWLRLWRLCPGGTLVTDSDFHADADHPMHHERDDWADVLAVQGFVAENPCVYRLAPVREVALAGAG